MHGLLVLDKPEWITSAMALSPIKTAVGRRVRVGHAGTLDPFATGVLLALVGDATRLAELAVALPKTYEATVRFGEETETLDTEGEVVKSEDPGDEPPRDLERVLDGFTGEIEQVPPAFSALKVGGRRAYRLARKGKEIDLAPRRIRIHEIRRLDAAWPDVRMMVRCGAGTYVRALARDLGRAVGLPAHLLALRRTAVGGFEVAGALPVDPRRPPSTVEMRRRLVPLLVIARAAGLPEAVLDLEAARAFGAGRFVVAPGSLNATTDRPVAVLTPGAETLLGLARLDDEGSLRPVKVLASSRALLR